MDPKNMTQQQRQSLWDAAGHPGIAPAGYGGEPGQFDSGGNYTGGGGGADGLINSSINAYQDQLNQYNKRFSEFSQQNPFNFDTILQEEQAKVKQRLDPYYNQQMGDYLQGVNLQKARGLEDENILLSNLQTRADQYVGEQKKVLNSALEDAGSGYANSGLYDSGSRARAQGNIEADANTNLQNYETQRAATENAARLQTDRYVGQDLPRAQNLFQRGQTQEETYNTQAQAYNQANQRQNQYNFAQQQYAGNLPGQQPMQWQNALYSNFLPGSAGGTT